jgi:hypothetical protein
MANKPDRTITVTLSDRFYHALRDAIGTAKMLGADIGAAYEFGLGIIHAIDCGWLAVRIQTVEEKGKPSVQASKPKQSAP